VIANEVFDPAWMAAITGGRVFMREFSSPTHIVDPIVFNTLKADEVTCSSEFSDRIRLMQSIILLTIGVLSYQIASDTLASDHLEGRGRQLESD
jgi:hypothetical protein